MSSSLGHPVPRRRPRTSPLNEGRGTTGVGEDVGPRSSRRGHDPFPHATRLLVPLGLHAASATVRGTLGILVPTLGMRKRGLTAASDLPPGHAGEGHSHSLLIASPCLSRQTRVPVR